ncbi:MAG: AAA family ATPase, partial [Bacteroidota bacterium]|nr:AAA family ATPase [Bacteroidota bacterium]
MLRHLHIQNYALINDLDIGFDTGLTVISGETGAGKSILLGALALILGQRADTQVLLDKTAKCIIEGTFDVKEYKLQDFFSENDLDYEDLTTLRREINIAGKSRAFINDTPVNLNVLKEMGVKLVDIHSQHHNILLGNNQFQLQVVDAFAGVNKILAGYKHDYDKFRKLELQYKELKAKNEKAQSDLDYFQFQFNQLDEAKLTEEEQSELESEQDILSHSEEIGSSLKSIFNLISEDESGILSKIREARNLMERIRNYFSPAAE